MLKKLMFLCPVLLWSTATAQDEPATPEPAPVEESAPAPAEEEADAGFDPTAEEYQVTPEMLDEDHDDYDEGAVDFIGQSIYKYLSLGGDKSALTAEQIAAAEGYYDRYDNAPFFTTSMLWTVIAAALVFLMHLGFATLESGLTQKKNTVNILFKNCFIIAIGVITYALTGFNTHYPGDFNGFFSIGLPIGDLNADGGDTIAYGGTGLCMTGYGDFIFQAMFAATAATIVSGAVAERIKLPTFMIFATILVGLAYPVVGSWHWGGGWLGDLNDGNGFKDFAGSAVVHAFGGFAALACVMILGPRRGKYTSEGVKPILPHNLPLAAIGVFLLFFGWFGFNGGSVLSADAGGVGLVFTTTTLAACAGCIGAMGTSWIVLRKPDLSMTLNGFLAGLVGITANADIVSVTGALIIGLIAGIIVVISVLFFDKIKIDDPVGAISVHGVCGIWGILACAIFEVVPEGEEKQFGLVDQFIGVLAVAAAAFIFSFVVFFILKIAMGVRVSEEEEEEGLDVAEHGAPAYTD